MAITHTPMVIMVLGVRVTGVMLDGVIMVLGTRVTGVMVGIADNTFFGQVHYIITESYHSPPSMTESGGSGFSGLYLTFWRYLTGTRFRTT